MNREAHLQVKDEHLHVEETDQGLWSVSVYEEHKTPSGGSSAPRFYLQRRYYDEKDEAIRHFILVAPTIGATISEATFALREGHLN